jgi:hypothetical protein
MAIEPVVARSRCGAWSLGLVAHPEGGHPLAEVGDVERDRPGGAPECEVRDGSGAAVADPV